MKVRDNRKAVCISLNPEVEIRGNRPAQLV